LQDFEQRLKIAKEKVLMMPEKELDKLIHKEYKKRLVAFNKADWYIGEVSPNEVGVWRRAGNLPLVWTNGSLVDTAEKVKKAISQNSKILVGRASHVVPNILKINVEKIQNEKYLLPIIFQGGTGTRGRKDLKANGRGY